MSTRGTALIVGAGIAGLATAIALGRQGYGVRVLERRSAASEAGAGIQLGPNAIKALDVLGVRPAIDRVSFEPSWLDLWDGATGRRLSSVPLGERARARFGAPYLTLHRADLHGVLLQAASATPGVTLTYGFDVTDIEQAKGVRLTAADGRTAEGLAVIGADGIWSRTRQLMSGETGAKPTPTGHSAYRLLVPRSGLPEPFGAPSVGLWLGRNAHLVHYPVSSGSLVNIVAVIAGGPISEAWDSGADADDLLTEFAAWPKSVQEFLRSPGEWRRWSLYYAEHRWPWSKGAMTLAGDAAHPVLPFLAQGAGLGLEDAVVLADAVARRPGDFPAAFAAYGAARRERAARVARNSRRNGSIYHLGGLAAQARNAAMRLAPPDRLLASYDWLYGYDPAGVLATAAA